MHKRLSGLILCLVPLFALPLPAFAANQVNTMDIQAVIYADGSMQITQNWAGHFEEGTESYIKMIRCFVPIFKNMKVSAEPI